VRRGGRRSRRDDLGLLLARAGTDVVVLEKHADFLRDFRGDTIHPSTLEVLHELGVRHLDAGIDVAVIDMAAASSVPEAPRLVTALCRSNVDRRPSF
jgi:2-polyprenyl-6-methoxyphenol hydroxylase-like FAD-dependent oxidoreductase